MPHGVYPRRPQKHQRKEVDRDQAVRAMLDRRSHWYALTVPPQKEFTAEMMLRERGIDAFVPIEYRMKRVNPQVKKKVETAYVLAARYVFAGFSVDVPPWSDVFGVHIVRGIVGAGGEPTCIPVNIMRQLFARSDAAGIQAAPPAPNRSFKVGDVVKITDGPFYGYEVSLTEINEVKARVLIHLFNSLQEIEIPVDSVEAC